MSNYQFLAQWVLDQSLPNDARVLDYGCGDGQIVKELRKRGVSAFGCDVFYDGGNYSELSADLRRAEIIKKMIGDAIPFESSSFDVVVNNQVMEHVQSLEDVLAEIERVLKPGGLVLSLFPDRGVWREGHCGIPFLHWFPKNSRVRVFYAAGLRMIGFGYFKEGKSPLRWSRDFCEWLDKWTYYRSEAEVKSTYGKFFSEIQHIEDYWIQRRLGDRKYFVSWLPVTAQKLIANKLGGMAFAARKPR